MKAAVIAGAALVGAEARTLWTDLTPSYSYAAWLAEFNPRLPGTEAAFKANLASIMAFNAENHSWKQGVNQFTGLTRAEFKATLVGYKGGDKGAEETRRMATPADLSKHTLALADLPASWDWRTKGVVSPVKDQGGCGGCWSFSAAETGESMVAIATGKLFTFSEQQILSCSTNPLQCGGTGGCSGATQEIAFNYSSVAGYVQEKDYPYRGQTGTCDQKKVTGHAVATVTGYVYLPPNNATALLNALVTAGPLAISAAAEPWQSYESGVFDGPGIVSADVDHAIQLTGYGTDAASGKDYYEVRNSWSAGWGESGYIRVASRRNSAAGEPCATDTTPGDGDGCKGGPPSIQVCGVTGILSDTSYPTGAKLCPASGC